MYRVIHFDSGHCKPETILEVLRRVHNEYWGGVFKYDPYQFAEKLAKFGDCFLLARETGEGACDYFGGAFGYINDYVSRIAYVSFLGVSIGRNGLGGLLHDAFCQFAIQRGFSNVRLEVSKTNVIAVNFYRKNGYVPIEDRGQKILLERRLP